MASGRRRRVASTFCPRRVMVARSSSGTSTPSRRSAINNKTELVPMSIVATVTRCRLSLGEGLQIQHLAHVRLNDELDAAVLLTAVVRIVAGDRIGVGVAGCAPERGVEAALARQLQEHGARAHRAQPPIVFELTANERLRVGVAGDLEAAFVEVRVGANDLGDLQQDLLALVAQLLFAGVEEDVARELDEHAVVAHLDLEAQRRQLLQLVLQHLEALADLVELLGALRVLLERLPLLGEISAQAVDVHAAFGELLLQLVDLLVRSGVIRLALLARLTLGRELGAQPLVLANFLVPLLLRVAARDHQRKHQQNPEPAQRAVRIQKSSNCHESAGAGESGASPARRANSPRVKGSSARCVSFFPSRSRTKPAGPASRLVSFPLGA